MSFDEKCDPIPPIQKPEIPTSIPKIEPKFPTPTNDVIIVTPKEIENRDPTIVVPPVSPPVFSPPKSRDPQPKQVDPEEETIEETPFPPTPGDGLPKSGDSVSRPPVGTESPSTTPISSSGVFRDPKTFNSGRSVPPFSPTSMRRRRTSGHSVGSSPYTQEKGGFTEPPTQHGKRQGEEIEEEEKKCDCDDQEIESEGDEVRDEQKRTIYPYNKVFQTESGHFVEFDDTYGSERISINHRLGSFVEFHPTGDVVHKVAGDLHYSVIRDKHVHVNGYAEVTIDKALKILVNSKENENTEEKALNFDIHVGKNANINIYVESGDMNVCLVNGNANIKLDKGDINISQEEGNYNHYINGDYNLQCTGNMHFVVNGNVVNEIGGSRSTRIDGILEHLEMNNPESHYELSVKNHTFKSESNFILSKEYFHEVKEIFELRTGDNLVLDATRNLNLVSSGDKGHIALFCNGEKNKSPSSGEIRLFSKNHISIKSEFGDGFFEFGGGELHVSKVRSLYKRWQEASGTIKEAKFFRISEHENFLRLNQEPVQRILNFGFENVNIDWIFTAQKRVEEEQEE